MKIIAQFAILLFFFACSDDSSKYQSTIVSEPEPSGRQLAEMYCVMCHQFPAPELLDQVSWKDYMLPRMGYMLGIYPDSLYRESLIEPGPGGARVKAAHIFPKEPLLTSKEWEKINAYYLTNAPVKLPEVPSKKIEVGLSQFDLEVPQFKVSPPSSTLIQIAGNGTIYVGDAHSQKLLQFDQEYNLIKTGNVKEGGVNLMVDEEQLWLTIMGSFSPTDNPTGFILTIPKEGGQLAKVPMGELCRPVHTAYGDLNGDGFRDAVVSEFGKWTGQLSLFINDGEDNFNKSTLVNQTGPIKSLIYDLNADGVLDIITLFGQGNEGISIFYNDGQGNFERDQAIQFSPSNGSSSFDLFDYNADGFMDIIYTAGDNADFKPVMKPYHGVYIYQNDGNNNFEQVYFYQMNGAYSAIPEDFDKDGDLDIAAISFFPDYEKSPNEGFVYLENDGANNFTAFTFQNVNLGRWVVMDSGDIDLDGDIDLVLGSLVFEIIPKDDALMNGWIERGIPFVVLKNKFIK